MAETILLILLGWILGMVSPLILDEIRKGRRRVEVETVIRTELNELRLKLVELIYVTRMHLGTFDKDLLDWINPIAKRYQGAQPNEPFIQGLNLMSTFTDAKLEAYVRSQSGNRHVGLSLKKYTLPYLESKMDHLGMVPEKLQAQMLAIKAHLEIINEEVDLARFYMEKTFDSSLEEAIRSIVDQNLTGRYKAVTTGAKHTVDLINKLDEL